MIGDRLKQLRFDKKISQAKLAEMVSLSQQAVCKWEKNVSEPDSETLKILAQFFGVTVDYLLGAEIIPSIKAHTPEPNTLIEKISRLNIAGQKKVESYVDDLLQNNKYVKGNKTTSQRQINTAGLSDEQLLRVESYINTMKETDLTKSKKIL